MRRLLPITTVLLLLMIGLAGCGSGISVSVGSGLDRDTDTTNSAGEAHLYLNTGTDRVAVRDSATKMAPAGAYGFQVLGLADGSRRLYVAADPEYRYHPVISSGRTSSYYDAILYLPPADRVSFANTTSYHDANGSLLYTMAYHYGHVTQTTVSSLQQRLAGLAYGKTAALVALAFEPLNSATGTVNLTEIAKQSRGTTTDLRDAFQAIGWQYFYTSRGFDSWQNLDLWVIDPGELGINNGLSGALANNLIAVVAPTSGPSGNYSSSLRVELTWDAAVDLDLHLVRSTNVASASSLIYDRFEDCFWKYPTQNWGSPYQSSDDPRLLYDDEDGYGPETIVIDQLPANEVFSVVADYWGDERGDPISIPVRATVRVWADGQSTPQTFSAILSHGEPWDGDYAVLCDIETSTRQISRSTRTITRSQVTRAMGGKH